MNIVILIAVITMIVLLGRYILTEGHRLEQKKKFMKNINNFDKNKKQK
jgi:hypothetical protein|tara:strand:+ start:247 stop:390 length:144 start_codon:yes stop_codon:yes gene_type:complete